MQTYFSTTDPKFLRENPNLPSVDIFAASDEESKFKSGQKCKLIGLVDFPEFNGQEVTIKSFRDNGFGEPAYYIEGEINTYLSWVYEYRLEAV